MKAMKNFLLFVFILSIFGIALLYHNDIATYLIDNFIYRKTIITYDVNSYKRDYDFTYVQQTDNFYPKNKQDIYNIFYTVLNNGWDTFSFYCDNSYETCINDVNQMVSNNLILSNINNFVHPYNTFDTINITTNNFGKVSIVINYMYNINQISEINEKVDTILNEIIKEEMSPKEKIRVIHDYIIDNTTYDEELAENLTQDKETYKYQSHIAYGPLIEGYAICGGYSDAMAIFLNKLGIENFKVANSYHVWNYVLIDDNWYHLDLTWDDPVLSSGEQVILQNFFLINDEELETLDTNEHYYDKDVYKK